MAYEKNKELKTRIALKYDSYANWTTNNPVLLAGEIAIATIDAGTSVATKIGRQMQDLPNVVMKVGNGSAHYNDLPFVSALAADVYDWAKAAKKPTYSHSEIEGLDARIEELSDIDTNTTYQIVPIEGATYKYQLQSKELGGEWANVANGLIDMSGADTRLDAIEAILAEAGFGSGDGGEVVSVAKQISDAIAALDITKSQAAGADGLALEIVQKDGVIESISGSIAANTYDAYGAAAAVADQLGEYKTTNDAAVKAAADAATAAQKAADDEAAARKAAIEALDFAGVEGTQEGAVIKFVDKISEENGIVTAELGELYFNSAYNKDTNKAATMKDVTDAVADLAGAMHFEGVVEGETFDAAIAASGKTYAPGDIVIWGIKEYVFDGSTWVELGDEGAIAAAIRALTMSETCAADSTVKSISQENGVVSIEFQKIAIEKSQVAGLVDDLAALTAEDGRLAGLIGANDTAIKANSAAIQTIQGSDTDKSMRTVAADEAAKAIANTQGTVGAETGKYVASVKLENGILSGTLADLPTLPELSLVEGTATEPTAAEVTVVADIDVEGHQISDTRVKVATKAGVNAAIAALDADKDVSSAKHVMTGITEVDGVITSIDEVALADVAFSGNIKDLVQTDNTYVLFNCGTSSDVI